MAPVMCRIMQKHGMREAHGIDQAATDDEGGKSSAQRLDAFGGGGGKGAEALVLRAHLFLFLPHRQAFGLALSGMLDGRSPGSRINARHAFPACASGIHVGLPVYSCGGSCGFAFR